MIRSWQGFFIRQKEVTMDSETQDITLEPLNTAATTETGETGADVDLNSAREDGPGVRVQDNVEAEKVSISQGGAQNIEAQTVSISQGGAQNVKADKVFVEEGGIARAEARFIDVHAGGIAMARAENVTITDGGAAIVAAENVKMQDSVAVFVAANQIEGQDTLVIFDIRAAVIFALVLGFVTSLFKFIMGRRR
jgi:hypothetical protein